MQLVIRHLAGHVHSPLFVRSHAGSWILVPISDDLRVKTALAAAALTAQFLQRGHERCSILINDELEPRSFTIIACEVSLFDLHRSGHYGS
jgi:hypothetical protein